MLHLRFISCCYCWNLNEKMTENLVLLRKRKRRLQCKAL
jgi:hypothetical protein